MKYIHRLLMTGVLALSSTCLAVEPLVVGVGQSSLPDSREAGAEAARKAKVAMGENPPRMVLVFAAKRQLDTNLVAGVAGEFDRKLIHGCEGYSPLTTEGNFADQGHAIQNGVAVLVLGGAATIEAASANVGDLKGDRNQAFRECGRVIGAALRPRIEAASKGKLVMTFGNQHVGDNQSFVDGLYAAAGKPVIVVGAAAGGPDSRQIIKGEVVVGYNVAILLSGDFSVGTGLAGGGQDLVRVTEESLAAAHTAAGGRPVLGLVFDCGGRRGELVKQGKIAAEHQAIRKIMGKVPFFGLYGGGEIGTAKAGEAPKGVGFSVAASVISVQ